MNENWSPKASARKPRANSDRARVLLIEDDPRDAELIGRALSPGRAQSYELTVARDLASALALAQRDCDVVLLDLSLPDSQGLASLRELALAVPRTPIIVLTGHSEEATAVEAIRNGAQDFLVKGSDDGALLRRSIRYAIERKNFEMHLSERAHYDRLTGLVNRAFFEDRLENALARARRRQGRLALMFLDLDGFKAINDSLGHDAGDDVLRRVGSLLRATVRESDTAARYGGDEFTILVEHPDDAAGVLAVAQRVLDALRQPFRVADRGLSITTSIGIAIFPDHAADAASLLRHADMAMFRAKNMGRNKIQFHEAEES